MGISIVSSWLGHLGMFIAVLVIVWSCLKTMKLNTPTGRLQILLQLVTYYARFWFVWLLVWANLQLLVDNQAIYWLLIVLSLLYLYMSWIEPNRLRVSHHSIYLTTPVAHQPNHDLSMNESWLSSAKIAVLSDLHIGIFTDQHQLERLVKCINNLKVDAVLFLGDWLYHANTDLISQLAALKTINQPCYTVLSEADSQHLFDHKQSQESTPTLQLMSVLPTLGIQLVPEQGLTIAGISIIGAHDGSTMELPRSIEQHSKAGHPLVIVTHDIKQLEANPRILSDAKDNTLVVAGQTHGGQVNIPVLTPLMVRALTGNKLAAGLRKPSVVKKAEAGNNTHRDYQVWVNTGIGMTGLPFRFNCPPTIDVLTISIKPVND